jgi:replication fork clamp-binding protein CrfC
MFELNVHVDLLHLINHLIYVLNMVKYHLNVFVLDLIIADDDELELIEHIRLILHLKNDKQVISVLIE